MTSCSPRRVKIAYEDYLENTPSQEQAVSSTSCNLRRVRKAINFGNSNSNPPRPSAVSKDDSIQDMYFPVENCNFEDLYDFDGEETQCNDCGMEKVQTGMLVVCNQKKLALFRFGRVVYVIDERCPHMGGPLHLGNIERIGEARLLMVVCPWHKWRIEITSGKLSIPPGRGICNSTYPIRVFEDGSMKIGFSEIASDYFSMDFDF